MSRTIQLRRGAESDHSTFTGAIGEVTMDTTNKTLRVHDGETVGGTALAKEIETKENLNTKLNIDLDNITPETKLAIVTMCMPDYARAYSVPMGNKTNQNIAPTNGYVSFRGVASNVDKIMYIDGKNIAYAYSSQFGCTVPIAKGSKYYFVGPENSYVIFIPAKGC